MIIPGNDPFTQPSFSLGNRVARGVWNLVWLLLFRPSPRPLHGWRRLLLRVFGAQLGRDVNVYPGARIWAPWLLTVGNRVGIADGVTVYDMARITIGDGCVVSQGAHLCAGSHDIDSPNFQLVASPIELGRDVWICAEAFVGPGVRIAAGCVVGARGVVMRSIDEPYTVWAGNPAVRKRVRKQGQGA
jgi:putative colanic acid biosynthesis acetyltransferase WcaF